nr:hypothetical protein [Angustibacter aerolatus]
MARSRSASRSTASSLRDLGLGGLQRLAGLLVLGVEALLALLDAGHLRLEGVELVLGLGAPVDGLGVRGAQALRLRLGGLDAAAARGHLTGQPGQPLAAVCRGPLHPRQPLLLGLQRALGRRAVLDRLLEPLAAAGDLGLQRLLLGAHAGGLGGQLLGVAAPALLLVAGRREHPQPLGGHALGRAQPLAQARQPEPGLLRAGHLRGQARWPRPRGRRGATGRRRGRPRPRPGGRAGRSRRRPPPRGCW